MEDRQMYCDDADYARAVCTELMDQHEAETRVLAQAIHDREEQADVARATCTELADRIEASRRVLALMAELAREC